MTVSLSVATAQNTVGAGTDTLATIENLTGSAYDDILTGADAAESISGGAGDDRYTVDNAGDRVTELPGGGYDRVVSIEMMEHCKNYEMLLQRVASWLAPGGKFFVHILCTTDKTN